jgi:WD40 repeat protein
MAKLKILFLAANPLQTAKLKTNEERVAIQEEIRKSPAQDLVEIVYEPEIRPSRLLELFRIHSPQVVHFAGHGTEDGIWMEKGGGEPALLDRALLETLGQTLPKNTIIVVLNACLTKEQASILTQHVPCAIGMSRRIPDPDAVAFSVAFYQGLVYGESVRAAFDSALLQLRLATLEGPLRDLELKVEKYQVDDQGWVPIPELLEQQPRITEKLRLVGAETGEQVNPTGDHPPQCPFPGLQPFLLDDERPFYGRGRDSDELLMRIRDHSFLTIIGPSASGKSSLVFAGLIPKLRKSGLFGSGSWVIRHMRPGPEPLAELGRSFGHDPDDAEKAVSHVVGTTTGATRLLLIVDQLEEVFTIPEKKSLAFQRALLAIQSLPNAYVVLTVRADFYAELMGLKRLWSEIKDHHFDLLPMDENDIRDAIRKPAEEVGVTIEASLVERLTADAAGEPGALPFLQETLVLLWEKLEGRVLPYSAYGSLVLPRSSLDVDEIRAAQHGLQVAVALHANKTLGKLSAEDQAVARLILLRLVQFGEGRPNTRRQQTVAELRVGIETGDFDRVLKHLTDNRLLTTTGDEEARRVDIAHEALITGWPTLRRWIREHGREEELRRRLIDKYTEWVERGKGTEGLLGPRALIEAEEWLQSLAGRQLQFGDPISSLVQASKMAIDQAQKDREEAVRRESELARQAMLKAAEVLTWVGASALVEGQSAMAMHQFARSVASLADSPCDQLLNRHRLGFITRDSSRLSAILEHSSPVISVSFSPDGTRILVACADGNARICDAKTGESTRELKGHSGRVNTITFNPDGTRVLAASDDQVSFLWDALTGSIVTELRGHAGAINSAVFSPDGSQVLTASQDGTARVWDVGTGKVVELRGHTSIVNSAVFDGTGARIVTSSNDQTARVWGSSAGDQIFLLSGHSSLVTWAVFSPDGTRILTTSDDSTARLWNSESGATSSVLHGHSKTVTFGVFSPNGRNVVTVSRDRTARIWETKSGKSLAELRGHSSAVHSAAFTGDDLVITGSWDQTARVWDPRTGKSFAELRGHQDRVNCVAFSNDRSRIVTASQDRTIRVWDRATSNETAVLKGHKNKVFYATFSKDGNRVITASWDTTARIWDATSGATLAELDGHSKWLSSAQFDEDGSRAVTASADGTSIVCDGVNGAFIAKFEVKAPLISSEFSPNGLHILSVSQDGKAWVWNASDGALVVELKGPMGPVVSSTFSAQGDRGVFACQDGALRFWDLVTGAKVVEFKAHRTRVNSVRLSPDGGRILTASTDGNAVVWDASSNNRIAELKGHIGSISRACFSPDGTYIVTASTDRTSRVWEANSGKTIAELKGHNGPINSAEFSSDGRLVITSSDDCTSRVWDACNGGVIAELKGHRGSVKWASFSPDGKRVTTASYDHKARIWSFAPLVEDAYFLPLWIEIFTGTELQGNVLRGLARTEWLERRKRYESLLCNRLGSSAQRHTGL